MNGAWRSIVIEICPAECFYFCLARHDRIVALVTQMLELHQRRRATQTAADREMLQRQIDATDKEIDALVYALYGVTEEEVRVVEGA